MRRARALIVVLTAALAGCTSGGNNGPVCQFNDPAVLSQSAWPKFRHDAQNTGQVENALVSTNMGQMRWAFPKCDEPPNCDEPPKGPFAASPVLNGVAGDTTSETSLYIGSTDGQMYALSPVDGTQDTDFVLVTGFPITSTALVGVRTDGDAIFVGGGSGFVYGLDSTAMDQPTNWPSSIGAYISSSVNLNTTDGTAYAGTLTGLVFGVCPNGVARFFVSAAGTQSSPAIGLDSTVYIGGDDQQLRALRYDGVVLWAFSASGPILNAPVVESQNGATAAIYVADRGGQIFKVNSSGQAISAFDFSGANGGPVGPISSSPALAGGRLYVGSDDGNLYAVDTTTGAIAWQFPTDGAIVSSPAVATGAEQPMIVVGSNDGTVYFVRDEGASATLAASFAIGAAVRSSPAIGSDGTVYVGADDGRVYAIQ